MGNTEAAGPWPRSQEKSSVDTLSRFAGRSDVFQKQHLAQTTPGLALSSLTCHQGRDTCLVTCPLSLSREALLCLSTRVDQVNPTSIEAEVSLITMATAYSISGARHGAI